MRLISAHTAVPVVAVPAGAETAADRAADRAAGVVAFGTVVLAGTVAVAAEQWPRKRGNSLHPAGSDYCNTGNS